MKSLNKRILLASPTMHNEEMHFIQEAFEKNWIAPLGFNCDEFEKEMSEYLKEGQSALSVCSGTSALHLAYKLAGVKKDDIVLCSDMTFSATINPIIYEGGKPVFVDSEYETWNMDPKALRKAFKKYPQAKVVALVHLYGTPAKMDEIMEICNENKAIIVEDAAEALGSEYKGQKAGTFGKYNAISFNGNKIITTSGGGMLLTNSTQARERAYFWSTQSRENKPWYEHCEIGYNYRMSNVVAGIGRGQLKHLDEHRNLKEKIYRRYEKAFKDLPITLNPYLCETKPNFWLSCILIDKKCSVTFQAIMEKLNEANIESRPLWKPMHMQPIFKDCDYIRVAEQSIDEDLFGRGLCLPSDIKMTSEEQDYVIAVVRSCF